MHDPVKIEHFQMTSQTRKMSTSKLLTRREACRLVPQFICCIVQDHVIDNMHLIYTMEKQANNYHKSKTRNTKFAI
jgi:hypothetical protein